MQNNMQDQHWVFK